ncbi:MAG: thiolase family protein [Armatimonadetes bacterium]|nr:thiolase family protein [Armatimonadota bacterium]MDE2206515.1 thiolase family protein [Armatimonadota bacterium]
MIDAVVASGARTPIGRATRGMLRFARPEDMAAIVIKAAIERAGAFDPALVDEVVFGCAMPEQEQGMNVARIAALRADLPISVPAVTVNRFCASGLEAIAIGAQRIAAGQCHIVVAGGVESMSLVPFDKSPVKPNPSLLASYPDAYLSMGLTAENLAQQYAITREDADDFSLESHQRALAAMADGRFDDEIVGVPVQFATFGSDGKLSSSSHVVDRDECPRAETSAAALAALKPAFKPDGVVTAGNSSQRSDGAAAVVLMSPERARDLGVAPLGTFREYRVVGVPPETMGIGPAYAVPRLLHAANVELRDIRTVELNEAFAAQVLAVLKEFPMDRLKVNPNGGAVALGHPLGCTGARQAVTLLHRMRGGAGGLGIVSMCVGGGMGAAGLFEAAN